MCSSLATFRISFCSQLIKRELVFPRLKRLVLVNVAKKKTGQKEQLFELHEPVQPMPEGYYSGDKPNPNLRRFVDEHATPYDPKTDGYKVPAFNTPITSTKATGIYIMHTYWSKKPHDAIRQYIQHYTKPGDIVLDPFCG